jgi:hypothetical protein
MTIDKFRDDLRCARPAAADDLPAARGRAQESVVWKRQRQAGVYKLWHVENSLTEIEKPPVARRAAKVAQSYFTSR